MSRLKKRIKIKVPLSSAGDEYLTQMAELLPKALLALSNLFDMRLD